MPAGNVCIRDVAITRRAQRNSFTRGARTQEREAIMKFARPLKEVYIRLAEEEPALIYTVRYAGTFGISRRLPLEGMPDVCPGEQSMQLVRTERRPRAGNQREE
jgi:hypothetical protein